jgi:hypothetical protein
MMSSSSLRVACSSIDGDPVQNSSPAALAIVNGAQIALNEDVMQARGVRGADSGGRVGRAAP